VSTNAATCFGKGRESPQPNLIRGALLIRSGGCFARATVGLLPVRGMGPALSRGMTVLWWSNGHCAFAWHAGCCGRVADGIAVGYPLASDAARPPYARPSAQLRMLRCGRCCPNNPVHSVYPCWKPISKILLYSPPFKAQRAILSTRRRAIWLSLNLISPPHRSRARSTPP